MPGAILHPMARRTDSHLYLMTGGFGAGKTAIVESMRGIRSVAEPARRVRAAQRAASGTGIPEQDPGRFVEAMLEMCVADYLEAHAGPGPVIFDRGIPDCVAYARLLDVDSGPSMEAANRHRYHPRALVARPWREIYTVDDERTIDFEEASKSHLLFEEAYEEAGYTLVEIPFAAVETRASFAHGALTSLA